MLLLWGTYLQKVRHILLSSNYVSGLTDRLKFLVGDYSMFVQDWLEPEGGIHGYLKRFLASGDPTFQHIAIWTLLQLLEADDPRLKDLISQSTEIVTMINNIADRHLELDDEGEDGEGEVVALAKRSAALLPGGNGNFGKVQ